MASYDRNNVYEDEFALAFHDINPRATTHVLVIPKGEYISLVDFTRTAAPDMIVGFWRAVVEVAKQLGVEDGYRIAANHGPTGGQLVFHFHVHIVSGARK
jgi:histidine triad (HIT) family protein